MGSSSKKSSKSVVIFDDRSYQRQPSVDSYYSKSSTSSSRHSYSTMGSHSTSGSSRGSSPVYPLSKEYRSSKANGYSGSTHYGKKVTVYNEGGARGYDQYDPHPTYDGMKEKSYSSTKHGSSKHSSSSSSSSNSKKSYY